MPTFGEADWRPLAQWVQWRENDPEHPPWYVYGASIGGHDFPVYVRFGTDGEGRTRCTGLLMGPDAPSDITARGLREVPVADAIRYFAAASDDDEIVRTIVGIWPDSAPDVPYGVLPRGRRPLDDEHYRLWAEKYRAALAKWPTSPVRSLALAEHVETPTLRRWLAEARRRGFLGEATPGRAGERTIGEDGER